MLKYFKIEACSGHHNQKLENWKAKLESADSFMLKYSKITVCEKLNFKMESLIMGHSDKATYDARKTQTPSAFQHSSRTTRYFNFILYSHWNSLRTIVILVKVCRV